MPPLPSVRVQNENCEAEILLQGAQLMHFAPRGQESWIWNNPNTLFGPRKEIYGGVPVVFPWFNLLKGHEKDAPNHGFARQAIWNLEEQSEELTLGGAYVDVVRLGLSSEEVEEQGLTSPFWNSAFYAQMAFSFDEDGFAMSFLVVNRGSESFEFECALHSYFAVTDVLETRVESDGAPIMFPPFGSTVLVESDGPFRIVSPERTLKVSNRSGWRSTVVWNPGEAMEDVRGDDWRRFVCVEPAAIRDGAVSLAPGEMYKLSVEVEQD